MTACGSPSRATCRSSPPEAFSPSQEQALWTYAHNDLQVLQVAFALAIANDGEIFAGGLGANGFPAVACIWG